MAQLAEHVIGNDEVPGPNPGSSSMKNDKFLSETCRFSMISVPNGTGDISPI